MITGKIIIKTRFLLCSVLFFIATVAATVELGEPQIALEEVMAKLSEISSSQANFKETKTIAFLNKPLLSEGRLSYVAPDHIQKETLKPHYEKFEIKDDFLQVSKANGESHEINLQNYPAIKAFAEAYRGVLGGNLKRLEQFYKISFSGEIRHWIIVLVPKDDEMSEYIEKLVVEGHAGTLIKMITVETGGDNTEMNIIQVR